MSEATGHIELERRVDSITIGARHRSDPERDLAPLMRSIERLGLLQPVTITPDGVLVCGHRRLAAVKELGWTTLRVWVRTGVSDHLTQLLAAQDENTTHRPDRKSVVSGKRVSVRVDLGGRPNIKKKKN